MTADQDGWFRSEFIYTGRRSTFEIGVVDPNRTNQFLAGTSQAFLWGGSTTNQFLTFDLLA